MSGVLGNLFEKPFEQILPGNHAEDFPVFGQHRQAGNPPFDHKLGGFMNRGKGTNGGGVMRHNLVSPFLKRGSIS